MSIELSLRLPADPKAAASARHSVVHGLDEFFEKSLVSSLELLVSELVTNSIRHAGLGASDWVEIRLTASEETIRLEVSDPGPGFDPVEQPNPDPTLPGGWGLYLVSRLASRWGVESEGMTRVWLEIDRIVGGTSAGSRARRA